MDGLNEGWCDLFIRGDTSALMLGLLYEICILGLETTCEALACIVFDSCKALFGIFT